MVLTPLRRSVLPPIDSIKERLFGGFAISHSTEDEYAMTVYCSEGEFADVIEELGFSRSLFSALKVRFDGNVEDGSWVRRGSLLADDQLHLVTHQREDTEAIDVYAHAEDSKITHPVKHYRTVNYDAEAGVDQCRETLEAYQRRADNPPRYEIQPPHHRSWAWALHLLSFVSTPAAARVGRTIDRLTARLDVG